MTRFNWGQHIIIVSTTESLHLLCRINLFGQTDFNYGVYSLKSDHDWQLRFATAQTLALNDVTGDQGGGSTATGTSGYSGFTVRGSADMLSTFICLTLVTSVISGASGPALTQCHLGSPRQAVGKTKLKLSLRPVEARWVTVDIIEDDFGQGFALIVHGSWITLI